MENKQTAVEFLMSQVEELNKSMYNETLRHAKSLEQKQIVDAFDEGLSYNMYAVGGIRYYNETYGN
jgi:hypothetical protein